MPARPPPGTDVPSARRRERATSGNKLTTLPDEISRLTGLRDLRLASNNLARLPDALGLLTRLQLLDLKLNPQLSHPPIYIVSEGVREILAFLRDHGGFPRDIKVDVDGGASGEERPIPPTSASPSELARRLAEERERERMASGEAIVLSAQLERQRAERAALEAEAVREREAEAQRARQLAEEQRRLDRHRVRSAGRGGRRLPGARLTGRNRAPLATRHGIQLQEQMRQAEQEQLAALQSAHAQRCVLCASPCAVSTVANARAHGAAPPRICGLGHRTKAALAQEDVLLQQERERAARLTGVAAQQRAEAERRMAAYVEQDQLQHAQFVAQEAQRRKLEAQQLQALVDAELQQAEVRRALVAAGSVARRPRTELGARRRPRGRRNSFTCSASVPSGSARRSSSRCTSTRTTRRAGAPTRRGWRPTARASPR